MKKFGISLLPLLFIFLSNVVLASESEIEDKEKEKGKFYPTTTAADELLYSTIHIQTNKGTATSFIFDFESKSSSSSESSSPLEKITCLISNRHVVEHIIEGASTSTIIMHEKDSSFSGSSFGSGSGGKPSGRVLRIYMGEDFEKMWIKHPNSKVDLAAVSFYKILEENKTGKEPYYTALEERFLPDETFVRSLSSKENVTMVGYPHGYSDRFHNLPLFTHGITSTHPALPYNGDPLFLTNMTCYPGSSGSPTLVEKEGKFHLVGIHSAGYNTPIKGDITIPAVSFLGELLASFAYDPCSHTSFPTSLTPISTVSLPLPFGHEVMSSQLRGFDKSKLMKKSNKRKKRDK